MSEVDPPLYILPPGVETRWASPENPRAKKGQGGQVNAGRKGRPCVPLKAGETLALAEEPTGAGIIRRIWLTIGDRSPRMLRGIRFEAFWDNADKPAISAPFGDFFGTGLGRCVPFQSIWFSNPEGRSFNCALPMPFKSGMKIQLVNESGVDLDALYYDVDYTFGDAIPVDALYLHAHWRRENPTRLQIDYEILPRLTGRGRFLGVNFGVIADTKQWFSAWWGEGEMKIYLDGDREFPTLCGTGTEDYIGTGWGQARYDHLYQGCQVADSDKSQFCFYRYHAPDPVYFQKKIRATMHQIGCWGPHNKPMLFHAAKPVYKNGPGLVPVDLSLAAGSGPWGLFERTDDWSSCAYFYLDQPTNNLPPLAPVEERIAGLVEDASARKRLDV